MTKMLDVIWPIEYRIVAIATEDPRWADDAAYRRDVRLRVSAVFAVDEPLGEFSGHLWAGDGAKITATLMLMHRVGALAMCEELLAEVAADYPNLSFRIVCEQSAPIGHTT